MLWYDFLILPWWAAVLAVLIAILGAARLTRLVVHDTWPPVAHFRAWWSGVTNEGEWEKLFHCHWCFGPWAMALAIGTFLLSFIAPWLGWAWWLFWGWLALSYPVSQYVHFDEGSSE